MKIAIYTRVSTVDKGQDTENQRKDLLAYIQRQGWELVAEYTDHVSGSKGREKRPQFNQMLEDARLKHFEAVLVWALDRFTREGAMPCLAYINKLDEYGVGFVSLKEEHFNTVGVWRDMMISMYATLAKVERQRISERVKAGLKRAEDEGTTLGRPKVTERKKSDKIRATYKQVSSIRKTAALCGVGISTVRRVLGAGIA